MTSCTSLRGRRWPKVSQANAGLLTKDMRYAQHARDVLRAIPCREFVEHDEASSYPLSRCHLAHRRRPAIARMTFARQQSASTGLPEHMCRANMAQESLRPLEHGQNPRLPDARLGLGNPHPGIWRGITRCCGELPGAIAGSRVGLAFKLAGRPYALAAGDTDASWPGA